VWAAPAGASGGKLSQIFTPELSKVFVGHYRFLKGDTPNILKQGEEYRRIHAPMPLGGRGMKNDVQTRG